MPTSEFTVPGNESLINFMELPLDLPLIAVKCQDIHNKASLLLRYSSHTTIEPLVPFALLYFGIDDIDDPRGKEFAADLINDPEIHHCVVTVPINDPTLLPNQSVFDIVNYPAEIAALVEANIITLSTKTIRIKDFKVPLPVGTIHITTTMEDVFAPLPEIEDDSIQAKPNSKATPSSTTHISNSPKSWLCSFNPSTPSHTINAFVLFTLIQIVVFLCFPQLYKDAAPDMDSAPTFAMFRMIGIKECGLVLMYIAIGYTNDHVLMKMTVLGRMTVIPFTLGAILSLGAPTTMLFGILQDVSFGMWTMYALRKQQRQQQRQVGTGIFSWLTRLALIVGGCMGIYVGYLGLLFPEYVLETQPVWYCFLKNVKLSSDIHLGYRSVSLIYLLVGCYHVGIGVLGAHPIVFFSCALYHLAVLCAFTSVRAWRVDLKVAYRIPMYHFACMPFFLILAILSFSSISTRTQSKNRENRKKED